MLTNQVKRRSTRIPCRHANAYMVHDFVLLQLDYTALRSLSKVVAGHEPKQRPRDFKVELQKTYQADNVYQTAHVGPMVAEMVRPDVTGQGWGGYDVEKLRIAGLARAIQTRLPYLHHCNPVYCLKDRPSCRFFFPWPYQRHQCFDENTQRVALQRRLPEDDQFVVSVSTLRSLDETVHSQHSV